MAKNVLTNNLSEPLNGATTARVDIHAGDGNLTIDRLTGGEQLLASGTLQYLENQDLPARTLIASNGQATLTLRGSRAGQPWFHFPWAACNGATEWQIHLNPTISTDLTAHSDGGNVKLNLAGMAVSRVSADTGGGNLDIVLPDNKAKRVDHEMLFNIVPGTSHRVCIRFDGGFAVKFADLPGVFIDFCGNQVLVQDPEALRLDEIEFHRGFQEGENRGIGIGISIGSDMG